MAKTVVYPEQSDRQFRQTLTAKSAARHRAAPPATARAQPWERMVQDEIDDDSMEFDDELVRVIAACGAARDNPVAD